MMRLLKHLINAAYSKLSYQKRSLSLVRYELESGVYSVDARELSGGPFLSPWCMQVLHHDYSIRNKYII